MISPTPPQLEGRCRRNCVPSGIGLLLLRVLNTILRGLTEAERMEGQENHSPATGGQSLASLLVSYSTICMICL